MAHLSKISQTFHLVGELLPRVVSFEQEIEISDGAHTSEGREKEDTIYCCKWF